MTETATDRIKKLIRKDLTKEEISDHAFKEGYHHGYLEGQYQAAELVSAVEMLLEAYKNRIKDK